MSETTNISVLAIVGSRNYRNKAYIFKKIDKWIEREGLPDKIISGGASGVDTIAIQYAIANNIPYQEYKAQWSKYKNGAGGPIRNSQIVEEATAVLAFPAEDSVGTLDTIAKAKAKGLSVTIHNV